VAHQGQVTDQASVTLENTDGEIGTRLTISDPPTQAEVQALRDASEELADDVRALAHALPGGACGAGVGGRLSQYIGNTNGSEHRSRGHRLVTIIVVVTLEAMTAAI